MPLFDLSNLPYWLLLGLGVLLFLLIIVSGGGDDEADLESDLDIDSDVEVDLHTFDVDGASDNGEFSIFQVLGWLGFGKAPLMLLLATDLSLWGVLGWMANVVIGGMLGNVVGALISGVIFVGSLVISLLFGGQLAKPIGQIFASFGEDASGDRLVGCTGFVSTGTIPLARDGKIGQVDVIDSARNRVTVNAVLPDWAEVKPQRGDRVLVIDRAGSRYLVLVKDSPDQDRWLHQSPQAGGLQ